jgi:hypothetical protein
MGNVEMMVPPPDDPQAAIALSALVHALAETGSTAIVRYIKRTNALPYLGCLLPRMFAPNYTFMISNALYFFSLC